MHGNTVFDLTNATKRKRASRPLATLRM